MKVDRRTLMRASLAALGAGATGASAYWSRALAADRPPGVPADIPDDVWNPIEVTGKDAEASIGALPGKIQNYSLPRDKGEFHRIGSFVLKRTARPQENNGQYEIGVFRGAEGSVMPAHAHVGAYKCLRVLNGEVEVELDGRRWHLKRCDFVSIPANTRHGWTLRSADARILMISMGDRVQKAYIAMGEPLTGKAGPDGPVGPATAIPITIPQLYQASIAGDFQRRPPLGAGNSITNVTNLILPYENTPYVLAEGGGERFGNITFVTKQVNSTGQLVLADSEYVANEGPPAHFHARHCEDFFSLDGGTYGWANGKAVLLKPEDYYHSPARYLHAFRTVEPYNRFMGILMPGVFEYFFQRGRTGVNGAGGRAVGPGIPEISNSQRYGPTPTPEQLAAAGGDRRLALNLTTPGPDGYPLDNHFAKRPLPPQDPLWSTPSRDDGRRTTMLIEHMNMMCGGALLAQSPLPRNVQLARADYMSQRAFDRRTGATARG